MTYIDEENCQRYYKLFQRVFDYEARPGVQKRNPEAITITAKVNNFPLTEENCSKLIAVLGQSMDRLKPRDREILERRFGLGPNEPHTFEAISLQLTNMSTGDRGVTSTRVMQLVEKGVGRIRQAQEVWGLVK